MRPLLITALALAAPLAAVPGAAAQGAPQGPDASGWRVSVGAAAIVRPEWEGSSETGVLVVPDLDVRYGELFFASFRTGLGFNVLRGDGFRAGPYVKVGFGREEEDDRQALTGLGDIDTTIEPGAFAEVTRGPLRASLEVRQAIGGHEGLVVEASVDLRARLADWAFVGAGPRVRYGDDSYMEAFYGIDAGQSARSGLPRFDAGGGVQSVSLGATLVARLTPRWTMTVFGEAGALQGDAADSPLVRLRGEDEVLRGGVALSARLGAGR